MVRYGMVRYGKVRYGMVWCDKVWYGKVRYELLSCITLRGDMLGMVCFLRGVKQPQNSPTVCFERIEMFIKKVLSV